MTTQTTTKPATARPCHFQDGAAVAILTYILSGATKRTNYAVCAHHYAEFSRDNLVAERPVVAPDAQ